MFVNRCLALPPMRCYLIRHAHTLWNGENRLQGRSDVPLSPLGERQAECVGVRFASHRLQGLFTSDRQRSVQTAHRIISGNGHRLSPVVEPELAEIHLGAWEGLIPEEIDARFQNAYQQWREHPSSVVIPDGEPLSVFRERVRRALSRILSGVVEGEVAVVTHGGVIAAFLADTLGADYDRLLRRLRLDNAGITAIEFEAGVPHVLWINSTTHLEEAIR